MTAKKATIKKADAYALNTAWKGTKVKGLSNEACKDYFHLKIKLTEVCDKLAKDTQDGSKLILAELGYKEGDKIPPEKLAEAQNKVNGALEKLYEEEVELNTHILSPDDLFNSLLNIDENKDLSTEDKSILVKYLMKDEPAN
jgi:hypothetical protein